MKKSEVPLDKSGMLAYMQANKSEVYALAFPGKTDRQARDGEHVTNLLVFQKNWVECNFDFWAETCFAMHGVDTPQPKTKRIEFLKIVGELKLALYKLQAGEYQGIRWLTLNRDYSDFEKSEKCGGTRAHSLEKAVCKKLGYRWCGGLKHSAEWTTILYEDEFDGYKVKETTIKQSDCGRRVTPDGWKQTENGNIFLEVKCICGRFIKAPETSKA
jgi:hypothetical protein